MWNDERCGSKAYTSAPETIRNVAGRRSTDHAYDDRANAMRMNVKRKAERIALSTLTRSRRIKALAVSGDLTLWTVPRSQRSRSFDA